MKVKYFRKPFVMVSFDDSDHPFQKHFHIVVGKLGRKFVSFSVTHSPSVPGCSVKPLPDNIRRSYYVSDPVYVRPSYLYSKPHSSSDFDVSTSDWRELRKALHVNGLRIRR